MLFVENAIAFLVIVTDVFLLLLLKCYCYCYCCFFNSHVVVIIVIVVFATYNVVSAVAFVDDVVIMSVVIVTLVSMLL